MLARAKRSERSKARIRGSGPAAPSPAPRDGIPARPVAPDAGAQRRDLDPSLDTAVYNCHCGYVFETAVSTSIACPHCGDAQGW